MAFNIHAAHDMVIAHLDLPYIPQWIGTVLIHTAGTVYSESALSPGDAKHRLRLLIVGSTPSERGNVAADSKHDHQVCGYSIVLASVVTLWPTSA